MKIIREASGRANEKARLALKKAYFSPAGGRTINNTSDDARVIPAFNLILPLKLTLEENYSIRYQTSRKPILAI